MIIGVIKSINATIHQELYNLIIMTQRSLLVTITFQALAYR